MENVIFNIDLGNIWEMLSAIGTVGAVILSLYLARSDNKKNIKVSASYAYYVTDSPGILENCQLAIQLVNNSKLKIKIKEVGVIKKGHNKRLPFIQFPEGSSSIPVLLDEQEDVCYYQPIRAIYQGMKNAKYKGKIRAYATDNNGKMYYSKKFNVKAD